jgi:hypothetical protein
MKWSYTVARVSGIDIKIHATFALILALGAFHWGFPKGLDGESSFAGAVFGMGLMILLFGLRRPARAGAQPRRAAVRPDGAGDRPPADRGVARLEKNPRSRSTSS